MHDTSERITLAMIRRGILSMLALEKGALRTSFDLAVRPGPTILGYLGNRRSHLTNPLRYLVFSAAAVTGLMLLAASVSNRGSSVPLQSDSSSDKIHAGLAEADRLLNEVVGLSTDTLTRNQRFEVSVAAAARSTLRTTAADRARELAMTWANVMLITAVPIFACISLIIFRSRGQNFAEHLVVNAYVLGFQNVLAVFMVVPGFFGGQLVLSVIYLAVSIAYQAWVWRSVFAVTGLRGGAKLVIAILASLITYLVFQALATALLLHLSIFGAG